MAHSYAALYNIPVTGLRFFTVYGPWGRPDMAYFSFTKNILAEQPINLFNSGNLKRDFTYIDDITQAIALLVDNVPDAQDRNVNKQYSPGESFAPYRLFNIGNSQPVDLTYFISLLEEYIGKKAIINRLPMQSGDMYATYADIDTLTQAIGFKPKVSIEEGLKRFVAWYKMYSINTA